GQNLVVANPSISFLICDQGSKSIQLYRCFASKTCAIGHTMASDSRTCSPSGLGFLNSHTPKNRHPILTVLFVLVCPLNCGFSKFRAAIGACHYYLPLDSVCVSTRNKCRCASNNSTAGRGANHS